MSNLKLNCLYCSDSGFAKLLPSEITFSGNGDAPFDAIDYAETASKNEQTDGSAHTSISISSGDPNYGYSGAEGFVSLADYNSRLLILIDGYRYKNKWFNSIYVDRSFLIHADVISPLWALSIQKDFSVNNSLPNNGSIRFDYVSPYTATVKPWMGFMYNRAGKFALKSLNKTSFRLPNPIKLNSSVLITLAKPDLSPEKWVTAEKCTNCKTGYIDKSASSNLALFRQNSIQGLELCAGGNNFFDEHSFHKRSYAHKQAVAQSHGLTLKIKYGIDF